MGLTQISKIESVRAELRRRSLIRFVADSHPGYEVGWLHEKIAKELEDFLAAIIRGESPRLMITVPPRHGKSFISTERFPAWALGKYPHLEFICTSYGAEKAEEFSMNSRSLCQSDYYKTVFPKFKFGASTKLSRWNVKGGGQYKAVGVGGSVTGSGAHCMIIDDPVKDWEEAVSKNQRERVWNWYASTAYTRLAPGGGVLVIQTRWHDDDLSGRILKKDKEPKNWRVVDFPAIAEKDEEFRKKGEALHPARFPVSWLKETENIVGKRVWTSLYQQKPRVDGGMHIKREWFDKIIKPSEAPTNLQWRRFWDLAIKAKKSSDFTASACCAMDKDGTLYISKILHFKREWPSTKRIIVQTAKLEKTPIGIENVSAFEIAVQEIKPLLRGVCRVKGYPVTSDKLTRALPWIDLAENGKVVLVDGPWIPGFLDECESFDPIKDSDHDDQVDAVSGCFQMVRRKKITGIL